MKLSIKEYATSFDVDLSAETVEDANLLVRLAMNAKRIAPNISIRATGDKTISGWITIGKVCELAQQTKITRV